MGIYGISVRINKVKGNKARKKEKAMLLALDVKVPLKIPVIYISRKS